MPIPYVWLLCVYVYLVGLYTYCKTMHGTYNVKMLQHISETYTDVRLPTDYFRYCADNYNHRHVFSNHPTVQRIYDNTVKNSVTSGYDTVLRASVTLQSTLQKGISKANAKNFEKNSPDSFLLQGMYIKFKPAPMNVDTFNSSVFNTDNK